MSDLTDHLDTIREAADAIGQMVRYKDIPDPSAMYIEPNIDDQGRRGPSLDLGCQAHGIIILFPWGGGGRVYLNDLIAEARKHLEGKH